MFYLKGAAAFGQLLEVLLKKIKRYKRDKGKEGGRDADTK
jgi:hypothetical protein